jgi:hypothetical protein
MSSVVLTGDTSGAGTITVPAVAGTFTATMGSATGTHFPFTAGTAVASTSGTSIDFTGIPSWVKRITVMLNGVSSSGTSNYLIQGGSGSIENTGYSSLGTRLSTTTLSTGNIITTGLVLTNVTAAASLFYGTYVLTNVTGNTWSFAGGMAASGNENSVGFGGKTFSGVIDRIRFTTVNGTDTFDAGTINILWE